MTSKGYQQDTVEVEDTYQVMRNISKQDFEVIIIDGKIPNLHPHSAQYSPYARPFGNTEAKVLGFKAQEKN